MNQLPEWVKALQIEKPRVEEWKAIAPSEESFIFWCLRTGRVAVDEYFRWAQENFGLSKVNDGYFRLDANRQLWKAISKVANWSAWMLPLEMWDDVIFIGCVEPPLDVQWSFPVVYVLADPHHLQKRWEELHGQPVGAVPPLPPQVSQSAPPKLVQQVPSDTPPPPPQAPPQAPAQLPDLPLGSKLTLAMPLPGEDMKAPLGISIPAETVPPAPDNQPLGLSLSLKPPTPNAEDLQDASSVSLVFETTHAPAGMVKTSLTKNPLTSATSKFAAKPAPAANVISKAEAIQISAAPEQIGDAKTQEACVAWCFRQLRTHFSSAIFFLHGQKGLIPWKWDIPTKSEGNTNPVSFDTPSLFRVAARTLRPYHGFVVENPAHTAFFKSWGFPALPKHVTGIPIVINGHFRGLVLCIGTEADPPDNTLEFAEMITDRTVHRLEEVQNPFGGEPTAA